MITQDHLKSLLWYDAVAGVFVWKRGVANVRAGRIAGSSKGAGYVGIRIDGVSYYAHRLAFLYVEGNFPDGPVDHVNMNKRDNSFANLRKATDAQNKMNRRALSTNQLGVKGVSLDTRIGKYVARIKANGRQKNLGGFSSIEAAKARYDSAANENFGSFARSA